MTDDFIAYSLSFWIGFSVVVGFLSKSKGGSFIAGFFMSLIISPLLAGLIVLVRSPKTDVLEGRQMRGGSMKRCQSCAEMVRKEASKCRFCGSSL